MSDSLLARLYVKTVRAGQRARVLLTSSDFEAMWVYLTQRKKHFAVATLRENGVDQTIVVYAERHHGAAFDLTYYYLTGKRADAGGSFLFSPEDRQAVTWDRKPLMVENEPLTALVKDLQHRTPTGMRWPLWKDSKQRIWYFSDRSNVHNQGCRGYSFVLHRDEAGEDDHEACYHTFYTNFEKYSGGTWLWDSTQPVFDPHHYEWVSEDDLINDARRQFNARYNTDRKLDMVLRAISRLSGDRLIEHPEIVEMERYRKELLIHIALQKKAAIDNPQVHFIPSKRDPDHWATPDFLHTATTASATQQASDDDASLTDRGDSCTSTDSPSDNPQE